MACRSWTVSFMEQFLKYLSIIWTERKSVFSSQWNCDSTSVIQSTMRARMAPVMLCLSRQFRTSKAGSLSSSLRLGSMWQEKSLTLIVLVSSSFCLSANFDILSFCGSLMRTLSLNTCGVKCSKYGVLQFFRGEACRDSSYTGDKVFCAHIYVISGSAGQFS